MAEPRNEAIRRALGWYLKPDREEHDHTHQPEQKPVEPPPENPKGTP